MGQAKSPVSGDVCDPQSALLQLGRSTLRAEGEEHLWQEALVVLQEYLEVDCIAALRRSDDGCALEFAGGIGLDEANGLQRGACVTEIDAGTFADRALAQLEPFVVEDLSAEEELEPALWADSDDWQSVISVGLSFDDNVWGVCEFYWRKVPSISEELLDFIEDVTSLLGEAIARFERERERARHAEQIEKKHRELYLLVEHAHDLIGTANMDGRVTYLNPAGCRLIGLEPGDGVGRPVEAFLSDADTKRLYEEIVPQVAEDGSWRGHIQLRDFTSGEFRHTRATVLLLEEPATGEPIGYATIQQDVSRQVRLEEQLRHSQKLEALGLLASGVAHDFNNHLTVIKGYSELLLDDLEGDEVQHAKMKKVRDVALKAQGLADQLLTFSRRKVRQSRVLDLNAVLENLEDMLKSLIGETITIEIEPAGEPTYLEMDPSDIEQVILNLAVNARDAIEGTGTICLQSRRALEGEIEQLDEGHELDEGAVVLEVHDTGRGMTPEVLDHVFEPFFTTKDARQGTGLGLATVKRIVDDAGGTVTVDSEPGKGTQFMLYFPLAEPTEEEAVDHGVDISELGGDEVILVVEDDPDVLEFITDVLERHGYHTIPTNDGRKAIDVLEMFYESIDAVLCDVMLPNLPPEELKGELIDRFPEMPIVLTSGYSDLEQLEDEDDLEDVPFLPKPIGTSDLLEQLRALFESN